MIKNQILHRYNIYIVTFSFSLSYFPHEFSRLLSLAFSFLVHVIFFFFFISIHFVSFKSRMISRKPIPPLELGLTGYISSKVKNMIFHNILFPFLSIFLGTNIILKNKKLIKIISGYKDGAHFHIYILYRAI